MKPIRVLLAVSVFTLCAGLSSAASAPSETKDQCTKADKAACTEKCDKAKACCPKDCQCPKCQEARAEADKAKCDMAKGCCPKDCTCPKCTKDATCATAEPAKDETKK